MMSVEPQHQKPDSQVLKLHYYKSEAQASEHW